MHGYGVAPRKPLLQLKEADGEAFMTALDEMIQLESHML